MRFASISLLLCLVLPCLAGCTYVQPTVRPGLWHPLGANAANLRAMVADPRDLYMGRGTIVSAGDEAAAAVARLRADAVKKLPASSVTGVHMIDTSGPDSGGGATPAAPVSAPPAAGAAP